MWGRGKTTMFSLFSAIERLSPSLAEKVDEKEELITVHTVLEKFPVTSAAFS